MSAIVEVVSDVVGGAVEAIGDVVEDVGDFVVDDIVKPVANAVEKTVEAALDDPVGTAIRVAAAASGQWWALPAAEATITVANGGDLDDALKRAAVAGLVQQAGVYAGNQASSFLSEAGAGAEAAQLARGAASGATKAGLSGGDIGEGALMGGLNAGTSIAAKALSDQPFEEWSRAQAEKAYENSYSPTDLDVLAADSTIPLPSPLSTPTDATGPGYYNEITGEYIPSEIGGLQAPLTDTSGTNVLSDATPILSVPTGQEAKSGSDLLEPPSDNLEGYDPLLDRKDIKKGLDLVKDAFLADDQQQSRLAGIRANANQVCAAMGGFDTSIPWLSTKEQMLRNRSPIGCASGTGISAKPADLDHIYKSITPELGNALAERGIGANIFRQETPAIRGLGEPAGYASAGTVSSTGGSDSSSMCSTWGAMGKYMPKFYQTGSGMLQAGPKRQGPALSQLKQMQSHISSAGNIGGMARGGLPAKYQEAAPEGHNPEFVTGLTGYYACGGGTGQSDDISAMLHDGDYVMDADVVAALGDGSSKAGKQVLEGFLKQIPHRDTASGKPVPAKIADGEYVFPEGFVTALGGGDNKAGAKILDGMRERLRAHKRSAPTSKIPPKAKSPLDYIKGMKG